MNRDRSTLLAMGFQGAKALQWKLKYITTFNEMERQLSNPQLPNFNDPVIVARAWATK
jgi:phage regulator Rha-like protein